MAVAVQRTHPNSRVFPKVFDRFVQATVGLDGVAQAFTDLGNPEGNVKILVKPNG